MYQTARKKITLFCYLLQVACCLSLVVLLAAPVFILALTPAEKEAYQKAIVPCGTFDENNDGIVDNPCRFTDVIKIARNVITFLIMIGATIAVMGFAYAGYLYITAMGSEEKIKHAHSIFYKTILGFALMLGAWLIALAFEQTFLSPTAQRRSFLQACPENQVLVEGKCVAK